MESLMSALPWIQIVLAVTLTVLVLVQQRGASLGAVFGGNEGTIHYERRGFERTLFQATAVIAVLFVVSVFLSILFPSTPDFTSEQQPVVATSTVQDAIESVTASGTPIENIEVDTATTTPQAGPSEGGSLLDRVIQ